MTGSPTTRIAWVALALMVVVPLVLVVWAVTARRSSPPPVQPPAFDRYEPAWASAMAKAGVEATFPAAPFPLTQLRAEGSRSIEATFTAEEIAALVSVYSFESEAAGRTFGFSDASISLSPEGAANLEARLLSGGSSYPIELSAPVGFDGGRITSSGLTRLQADGFTIGGRNRRRAGDAMLEHFNKMLDSAPGMTIEEIVIGSEGVRVRATVPVALTGPENL